ncbi:hypothetical protein ACUN0C_14230 [Faunimonas sp. B44]|uniref:hypothetical protein n=1 Tax=Faunimonas sp. B44 TaxID=3461493 RepID=UPI004043C3FE
MAKARTNLQLPVLLGFHATVAGGFLVSYLTGDGDDFYFMHVFSGYVVLAALALRMAIGVLAPPGSMLRLPRPDWGAIAGFLRGAATMERGVLLKRSPLHGPMAVALLAGLTAAAASGAIADFVLSAEDLHEAFGEAALFIVIVHVALVLVLHGAKRLATPRAAEPAATPLSATSRTGGAS